MFVNDDGNMFTTGNVRSAQSSVVTTSRVRCVKAPTDP